MQKHVLNTLSKFLLLAFFISATAVAGTFHLTQLMSHYPWLEQGPMGQGNNACFVCHSRQSDEHNPYGQDYFETGWNNNGAYDLKAIEDLDSDGDGFTNLEELKANTYPGDRESFPAP